MWLACEIKIFNYKGEFNLELTREKSLAPFKVVNGMVEAGIKMGTGTHKENKFTTNGHR